MKQILPFGLSLLLILATDGLSADKPAAPTTESAPLAGEGNIYAGDIIGKRVQKFLRKQ